MSTESLVNQLRIVNGGCKLCSCTKYNFDIDASLTSGQEKELSDDERLELLKAAYLLGLAAARDAWCRCYHKREDHGGHN